MPNDESIVADSKKMEQRQLRHFTKRYTESLLISLKAKEIQNAVDLGIAG